MPACSPIRLVTMPSWTARGRQFPARLAARLLAKKSKNKNSGPVAGEPFWPPSLAADLFDPFIHSVKLWHMTIQAPGSLREYTHIPQCQTGPE